MTVYHRNAQKFRYIIDCSHNCACLLFSLPSLSFFVLNDFPVCLINKRQIKAGQYWSSLLYQGKGGHQMYPKSNPTTAKFEKFMYFLKQNKCGFGSPGWLHFIFQYQVVNIFNKLWIYIPLQHIKCLGLK